MAMFDNFLISKQLGFFDSLNEKTDNRYGLVVHLSEIEANTPATGDRSRVTSLPEL
jgi:hypothetical protein